jgi:hypothetical protein
LGRFEFLLGAPKSPDPLPPLLEDAVWLLMIVLKDASKQANKQTLVVSVSLSFSEKNTKTTEERKTLTEKERKFRKKEMVEKTV